MPDYQNGRIYNVRRLIYFGSNTMSLSKYSHYINQIQVVVYID